MSDRTCRCDYTAGYAFVTEPRNKCYCVPTEEDCMCYKVNCPRKKQLTQGKNIFFFISLRNNIRTIRRTIHLINEH